MSDWKTENITAEFPEDGPSPLPRGEAGKSEGERRRKLRPRSPYSSPACARGNHRGFTLVEVVVSTLLIGLVMIGALRLTGSSIKSHRVVSGAVDGPALAHQMMAEVLASRFEDADESAVFGHELSESQAPTTRVGFDDIDDYDGWSASPPQAKDGTKLSSYSGWTRAATVVNVTRDNPTTVVPDMVSTGVRRIMVTVTNPDGDTTTLVALRSRWGVSEQSPMVDTTVVTTQHVEIQIGSGATPVSSAIMLSNHASDG